MWFRIFSGAYVNADEYAELYARDSVDNGSRRWGVFARLKSGVSSVLVGLYDTEGGARAHLETLGRRLAGEQVQAKR